MKVLNRRKRSASVPPPAPAPTAVRREGFPGAQSGLGQNRRAGKRRRPLRQSPGRRDQFRAAPHRPGWGGGAFWTLLPRFKRRSDSQSDRSLRDVGLFSWRYDLLMTKKKHALRSNAASATLGHVSGSKLAELLNQLTALKEPEIVLIKAHMLVERVLIEALAARLRTAGGSVPRLPYGVLVDLAARPESRKKLVWFNELRNAMAHEFDPLEKASFTSSLAKFGIRWPKNARLRLSIAKALGEYVVVLAWREVVNNLFVQLTLQRASSLPPDAQQMGEIYSSLTPLLEGFDDLVNQLAAAALA